MNIYYVYAYIRSKDSATAKAGTPYYIGKGKYDRAYKTHIVPVPKDRQYIVFLETGLTELGALALERRMIRWYGRTFEGGILRNTHEGGTGGPQPKHVRKKISDKLKGKFAGAKNPGYQKNPFRNLDQEALLLLKQKQSRPGEKNSMYGRCRSEEFKKFIKDLNSSNPIYCKEVDRIYPSQMEASRDLGLKQSDINNMLKGRQKTVKGYTFMYYIDQ